MNWAKILKFTLLWLLGFFALFVVYKSAIYDASLKSLTSCKYKGEVTLLNERVFCITELDALKARLKKQSRGDGI